MEHLRLLPNITPPEPHTPAQRQAIAESAPIYINRPVMTDAEIERALEQELAA